MRITILFGGTNKERLVSVASAQALHSASTTSAPSRRRRVNFIVIYSSSFLGFRIKTQTVLDTLSRT